MVTPQPESDLSLNIMVVGADIINMLKQNKDYMIIEDLMKKFISKDSRRSPNIFFDTITFLYVLGLIGENNYKVRLKHDLT